MLRKIRQYVQESTIRNIYNSFLKAYTDYGTLVWCGTQKCNLTKMEKILNKSSCTMLFKGKYDSFKPLYKCLSILPLPGNIRHNQGKFMSKLVSNQQPKCVKEKFPFTINEAINNSSNNKMITPYRRTTTGKRSLSYEGYKLWNLEIPDYIRTQKTLRRFSRSYHAYLIDNIHSLALRLTSKIVCISSKMFNAVVPD